MIIDSQLELSKAQSLVGAAGTVVSTNVIDQGSDADQHVNAGIRLGVAVAAALTGLTSLDVHIETDDNEAFASPKTVFASGAIPAASLTAGAAIVDVEVPRGTERYLRTTYTTVGTTTAGSVHAHLVVDTQRNRAYRNAYDVA